MANFKFGTEHNQNGKISYNAGIVNGIVALAVGEVEGAMLVSGKKRGINLYFEKDGIYADVSVMVRFGYNIPELAYRIQQAIKQNVENMTRYKIANVDVHIQDTVFTDTPKKSVQETKPAEEKTEESVKPTTEKKTVKKTASTTAKPKTQTK